MAVNLSELSIRYPEFPKYLWDSPTPYSDAMQIKKDRRDPEHTKRPLNAFMLFAKIQRESITSNCSCNHSEISKALGRLWQELSKEEKEPFIQGGKTLVELHRIEFPDYKYRPKKKGQPKESPVKTVTTATARKTKPAIFGGVKPTNKSRSQTSKTNIKSPSAQLQKKHSTDVPKRPQSTETSHYSFLNSDSALGEAMSPPPESFLTQNASLPGASPLKRESSPVERPGPSGTPGSPSSYGSLSPYSPAVLVSSPRSSLASSPDSAQIGSPDSGLPSPPRQLQAPCSPVSSSGYDSEMSHCGLGLQAMSDQCWSPIHEPDIAEELRDLDVAVLEEAALLSPLAMFPVLDINNGDLDYLEDLQWNL